MIPIQFLSINVTQPVVITRWMWSEGPIWETIKPMLIWIFLQEYIPKLSIAQKFIRQREWVWADYPPRIANR